MRDRSRVVVGGGPVTREWADEIGADGYGETVMHAAGLIKELLSPG